MRPVLGAALAAVLVRSAAESAAPALYVSMTEYHGGSTFFSGVMDTHPCVCDMGEHFTGKGGVGVNLHKNNSFMFQLLRYFKIDQIGQVAAALVGAGIRVFFLNRENKLDREISKHSSTLHCPALGEARHDPLCLATIASRPPARLDCATTVSGMRSSMSQWAATYKAFARASQNVATPLTLDLTYEALVADPREWERIVEWVGMARSTACELRARLEKKQTKSQRDAVGNYDDIEACLRDADQRKNPRDADVAPFLRGRVPSPAARFPSEDPELCPGLGDASARSPPPSPAPARPCGDDWSGGDAWIYEPTPQLRTFNFCKKVVQLSRWPLVRGDMLLVTTGGLRGAVFQRVSEGGFDPETRAFDGVLRIERAAGGAATGRPLHFETQDRNHSRAALDDLRGCWRQPTPAPAPVFAFVSDPLDNFLRGFAQLMASSAEKRSRGESATQAISRRAFPSPAARLDAWLELHRVGRETTGLDRRVALQSWFLAYDARVADQRFQVAALWDATKLDDLCAPCAAPAPEPPRAAAWNASSRAVLLHRVHKAGSSTMTGFFEGVASLAPGLCVLTTFHAALDARCLFPAALHRDGRQHASERRWTDWLDCADREPTFFDEARPARAPNATDRPVPGVRGSGPEREDLATRALGRFDAVVPVEAFDDEAEGWLLAKLGLGALDADRVPILWKGRPPPKPTKRGRAPGPAPLAVNRNAEDALPPEALRPRILEDLWLDVELYCEAARAWRAALDAWRGEPPSAASARGCAELLEETHGAAGVRARDRAPATRDAALAQCPRLSNGTACCTHATDKLAHQLVGNATCHRGHPWT
ncbi:hypothetical protein JL720_6918 [Aureococcus anophagefferens]|nr:hypothetical protein JL720_6918 [Aureococcus anophagefferens]